MFFSKDAIALFSILGLFPAVTADRFVILYHSHDNVFLALRRSPSNFLAQKEADRFCGTEAGSGLPNISPGIWYTV